MCVCVCVCVCVCMGVYINVFVCTEINYRIRILFFCITREMQMIMSP